MADLYADDGAGEFLGQVDVEPVCGEDFCDRCGCCLAEPECRVNDCEDGCWFVIYGTKRWTDADDARPSPKDGTP